MLKTYFILKEAELLLAPKTRMSSGSAVETVESFSASKSLGLGGRWSHQQSRFTDDVFRRLQYFAFRQSQDIFYAICLFHGLQLLRCLQLLSVLHYKMEKE